MSGKRFQLNKMKFQLKKKTEGGRKGRESEKEGKGKKGKGRRKGKERER